MNTKKEAFVDWGSFAEKASETEWIESIILEEREEMAEHLDEAEPWPENKEESDIIMVKSMPFNGAGSHSGGTNMSPFLMEVPEEEKQPVEANPEEWTVVHLEIHELLQPEAEQAASTCSQEGVKEVHSHNKSMDVSKFDCFMCGVPYTHCSNVSIHYMALQLLRCPKCPRIHVNVREGHKNHLRTHMGLRPYGCHICGKHFGFSAS
ncbi:zinc finger protein 691-like [Drosophila obscura]|uniref:zinc finger protein 691-like n=1 Tax=Drosophila obscura TaxID=7282 RepID=UPI001BB1E9FC|nr:zinc finger protein 691-like [Drosophila obscura]